MAKRIVLTAVVNNSKSAPFSVYVSDGYETPQGKVVLRLQDDVNNQGQQTTRIGNASLGLVARHRTDWLEDTLTGYRRKKGDAVYVVCELVDSDIPTINSLAKSEVF